MAKVWLVWIDADDRERGQADKFIHATQESAEAHVAQMEAADRLRGFSDGPYEIEEREVHA